MKFQGLATLLAAMAGVAAGPGLAAAPPDRDAAAQRIAAAAERDDCRTVLKLGPPFLLAAAADEPGLAAIFEAVASCERDKGALNDAYRLALEGTASPDATDKLWQLRLSIERRGSRDAAVATVEEMAKSHPAALAGFDSDSLWQLQKDLKEEKADALRRRLLAALGGDAYRPDDEYGVAPDRFRLAYARLLADAGEAAAARRAAAGLETASGIAGALLDPRLREGLPPGADVRAVAERSLERHRAWAAAHPERLGAMVAAAADLRALGRPRDAILLLETVRSKIGSRDAFEDLDEQRGAWWNALAESELMLGRYEAATAAWRGRTRVLDNGLPDAAPVIDLAQAQLAFGHADEALRTLAVFEQPNRRPSGYAAMRMRRTRACALSRLGRGGEARGDVAYLLANEKEAPRAVSEHYLCTGDLDGAAAAFQRRLADPDMRTDALLDLSDYDAPPVPQAADPVPTRLAALKTRTDVKAAIAKAGGIRRFGVQRGEI
jgi:hypothetical protein